MATTRPRRRLALLVTVSVVLATAACGSGGATTAARPSTSSAASSSPAAPDPVDLATRAREILDDAEGFTLSGIVPYEAESAALQAQVGDHAGHATLSTQLGTVTIDWDDAHGGLFLTAPATFWTAFGNPAELAGQQVSVPAADPLYRLARYAGADQAVTTVFQLLAGSPETATPDPTEAGVLDLTYDIAGSHLYVRAADGAPVRVHGTGSDVRIATLPAAPEATVPADGRGVPLPGY